VTGRAAQDQDHEELRPLLLSIAYRMVGSVTEAEDLVQDAYLPRPTQPAGVRSSISQA
jgi:DNA-directed RNA polymerase specialized sigma24 family protein